MTKLLQQERRRFFQVLFFGALLGFALAAGLFFGVAYASGIWPDHLRHSWPLWIPAVLYGAVRGLATAGGDLVARRQIRYLLGRESDAEVWRAVLQGGLLQGRIFGGQPRGKA